MAADPDDVAARSPSIAGVSVLVAADELSTRARELGEAISADHAPLLAEPGARPLLLVAVLKGSIPFLADVVRAISVPIEVDFMAISSYAPDTGRVRIVKDLDTDIHDRHVVVVEDIVDTGLTLTYLLNQLRPRGPRSVEVCTLLDKVARRIVPVPLRYRGFEIGDEFVIGYGLDFEERYRNLDCVVSADLRSLQDDPDAHVDELFKR